MSDLRLALESHAAGLAAVNHTDADLSAIKFALDAMRFLTDKIVAADSEQPFLGDLVREDIRFHIAIMAASKNELMQREIMRLHLLYRVVSGLSNIDGGTGPKAESDVRRLAVLGKHDDIYRAIASGNSREAKNEMGYHLQELIDHNLHALARAEAGVLSRDLTAEELLYSGHL
jgi:DNA-binding FadR family transcriptional regulator